MQEYVISGDVAEARLRLRGLAAQFFHHECVKQALLTAMQVFLAHHLPPSAAMALRWFRGLGAIQRAAVPSWAGMEVKSACSGSLHVGGGNNSVSNPPLCTGPRLGAGPGPTACWPAAVL